MMEKYTKDEMEELIKDAARYRYLRDNKLFLKECVTERRGIRGTMVNSPREVWYEHEGWIVSDMPIITEPFETMDEAVDAGIQAKWFELLEE